MNMKLKIKIIEHYAKQWAFAKALGIDESLVSKVVTGARPLPFEKQKVWANKLNCTVTDIFPGEQANE